MRAEIAVLLVACVATTFAQMPTGLASLAGGQGAGGLTGGRTGGGGLLGGLGGMGGLGGGMGGLGGMGRLALMTGGEGMGNMFENNLAMMSMMGMMNRGRGGAGGATGTGGRTGGAGAGGARSSPMRNLMALNMMNRSIDTPFELMICMQNIMYCMMSMQ